MGYRLLRDNVFKASCAKDSDELRARREPTMLYKEDQLVAPASGTERRYTLVLDLDETVIYAREGPLYARAYLKELLSFIRKNFEVIVWTAGEREYAECILEEINIRNTVRHLIHRHKTWFSFDDYTKDLTKLGRNLDYVIIIENSPDCVRTNPQNGIIVDDFRVSQTPPMEEAEAAWEGDGNNRERKAGSRSDSKTRRQVTDRTLLLLREVLKAMVESGETVPDFLAKCPLLTQRRVIGSDGSQIQTYHLGTRRKRGIPQLCASSPKRRRVTKESAPGATCTS
ncbi:TFIIF-stimulated CTD phosphatase, putative [Trypanosoma equiperdum]|uniref:Mitochondrial import inner membrane translocase subunit TIM50 n=4 Tax=Trypanozoon TaxID=39700 RepID=Q38DA6_TRYB2|nr:hypothetical protein, conserved [Trypanosoma brucei gambiense DAL972]XP_827544.1 hypothetical protein, conserved [Trypanosoma brucei brucei TREU927]RHW70427.1 TFIIF-stimulated CTD phosphatase [Trypanosoma brucei equiperdum]SCU64359.1 TFIIF-stimulated CTD phosphatase, putative [Trypanosoma equiperdum]EAN77214.1 hypothetical protein, conserved [Trypanosoma brucei brucei TREU927]CBH14739.1 hypothetical protein, conserved [Trypanosoma brucei gambiense DAL972]|eukprot:XP_011777005.1 hypothetical protein, conserved [Trypanosoma brucei gambiense DAL972]